MEAQIGVESVQMADRTLYVSVHGANPEAALAIALAIVEARLAQGQPGGREGPRRSARLIHEREGVSVGDQKATLGTQHKRSDRFTDIPLIVAPAGQLETVQERSSDINPIERRLGSVPDWGLTQNVFAVDQALGRSNHYAPPQKLEPLTLGVFAAGGVVSNRFDRIRHCRLADGYRLQSPFRPHTITVFTQNGYL